MIQNSNKYKIIGLTGGIATGKSTVSNILIKKGYPVIDADTIARSVVETGKEAYKEIVREFGNDILNKDLTINRQKLGSLIFSNREDRIKLNAIVHPRITKEIIKKINYHLKNNRVIFVDIPLLIEEIKRLENQGLHFNEIWLVYSPRQTQLERLISRDSISIEDAKKRLDAQMDIEEKVKLADVIINNTRAISFLEEELNNALKILN